MGKYTSEWKDSAEYKRIQEVLCDYWLMEPDEKLVTVIMDFQHSNGEEQTKQIVWRNPKNQTVATKKKRVKNPITDYYEAGALYRLWKRVGIEATRKLSEISQNSKVTDELLATVHRVDSLETKLGFESCLQADHAELDDKNFCSMFYGDIGIDRGTDTDAAIHDYLREKLQDMLSPRKKDNLNDDDVVKIRRRRSKMPTVNNNSVSLKLIKSGKNASGEQRYAVSFRFNNSIIKYVTSTGYLEFAFHKKNNRLYFLPSDKDYGYKISVTEQSSMTCSVKFIPDGDISLFRQNEGQYELMKDELENAYYIELK